METSQLATHFQKLRERDFPSLNAGASIYLDSAATALKPLPVVQALYDFYANDYGTVHRAVYQRAQKATELYDLARKSIAQYIGAERPEEVIFTKGTTDSINIVADALVLSGHIRAGRVVLISEMEHHSNIVPWQIACSRSGAALMTIPLESDRLNLEAMRDILAKHDVAAVAITHCSNILGTVNPISEIAALLSKPKTLFFVDGAQSAPHIPLDLKTSGADFFAFSSHKMSGPTGIGVLWGRYELLDLLAPSRGGGDMIDKVFFEKSSYALPPLKFEPGTPPIAEAIGFGKAIEYLAVECGGAKQIQAWEQALISYLRERLREVSPRIQLIGDTGPHRGALQSFTIQGAHPLDVATILDLKGVAIRSGHLCGQPLLRLYGETALLRASAAYYNSYEDIDRFISALQQTLAVL